MIRSNDTNRRTALKSIGAAVIGVAALSGSASARGNKYGRGNGIGSFPNEKAEFKDSPVWSSGVADRTGQSEVEVVVGALTGIDVPIPDAPEKGPFAFAPKAVEVSPGTDVTWTWGPGIHHSVTSVEGTGESFEKHGHPGNTFTHTFDEVGNYLYYCHPHGTPYPINLGPPIGGVDNLFGMRGAVKVSDD